MFNAENTNIKKLKEIENDINNLNCEEFIKKHKIEICDFDYNELEKMVVVEQANDNNKLLYVEIIMKDYLVDFTIGSKIRIFDNNGNLKKGMKKLKEKRMIFFMEKILEKCMIKENAKEEIIMRATPILKEVIKEFKKEKKTINIKAEDIPLILMDYVNMKSFKNLTITPQLICDYIDVMEKNYVDDILNDLRQDLEETEKFLKGYMYEVVKYAMRKNNINEYINVNNKQIIEIMKKIIK